MSWFTATKGNAPTCPRCKMQAFATFIRTAGDFAIYNCQRCGPVPQKEKK